MTAAQGQRVGTAAMAVGGRSHPLVEGKVVYRATGLLDCVRHYAGCQAIHRGDFFVRVGWPGGGARRGPACQRCEPFRLVVDPKEVP